MSRVIRYFFNTIALVLVLAACSTPDTSEPASTSPAPTEAKVASSVTPEQTEPPATTPIESTIQPVEPRAKLPDGPLKIVALGDSLTQGDGDESGLNGYPDRLAQLLAAQRPGTQALNLGKSGWTSSDLLNGANGEAATLPQSLAAKPNVALVWIGSNDLWYLYEYGPEPMTAEAEQQDLDTYAANIDSILRQLSDSGAAVFIALLDDQSKRPVVANPPNPSEPAFSAMTTDDLARMSAHVSAMNAIIKEKAALYGAATVDFYNTDIFTNPATLYSDGNHPNTTGYEAITRIWFTEVSH